jgi:predicted RNA-binding protein YlxR (DUF448 family)
VKLNSKNLRQTLKPRHIPQRSCIVCRTKKDKRELVRLVYSNNTVEVDPRGKKAGRGAYLCPRVECWETGLKKGRLDYALHIRISPENRQTLLEYANNLYEIET